MKTHINHKLKVLIFVFFASYFNNSEVAVWSVVEKNNSAMKSVRLEGLEASIIH